jgi:hypothetical protein
MVEDYFNSPNTKSFIFSLNLNSKNEKVYQIYNPLLFACVAISCTDLADGINVDPNALSVSDAQAKNIFQSALLANQYFQTSNNVRNTMLWLDQGTELTDNTFL